MEMVMLCKHISIREIEDEFYFYFHFYFCIILERIVVLSCVWLSAVGEQKKTYFELDDLSLFLLIYGHKQKQWLIETFVK